MTFVVVNSDATELRHQRSLPVDQSLEPFDLRWATAFSFQTFDESEQKQRALPDNAFGIRRKCLRQVQTVDIDFIQCSIPRAQYLPDGQRCQGTADYQQQEHYKVSITLHFSTYGKSGFRHRYYLIGALHRPRVRRGAVLVLRKNPKCPVDGRRYEGILPSLSRLGDFQSLENHQRTFGKRLSLPGQFGKIFFSGGQGPAVLEETFALAANDAPCQLCPFSRVFFALFD